MASDAERLRAERLYVEGGKSPAAIASDIGVARSTVYEWRAAGDWDAKRKELSDRIGRVVREASDDAVAASAAKYRILSRLEGLDIAAGIARDSSLDPRARIAALKFSSDVEGWAHPEPSSDGNGPPKRLVLEDPGDG